MASCSGIPGGVALSTMQFAAIAVGIASAALADVTDLAMAKVPAFTESTLAVGTHGSVRRSGRRKPKSRQPGPPFAPKPTGAWGRALAGERLHARGPGPDAGRGPGCGIVHAAAVQVVDTAYGSGRRYLRLRQQPARTGFRDAHALTQHFTLKPDTFTTAGAVLLGQEVDLTFL